MSRFPSWPTSNQGNIVSGRLSNAITHRFKGLMSILSLTDQRDAALTEVLFGTTAVFNVTAYGALGDGVTDDAAAIQTALTAAAVSGGVVYLPPGTYVVKAAAAGGKALLISSNVKLMGAGIGISTLTQTIGINGTILANNALGNSNITVSELTIDGDKAGQANTTLSLGMSFDTVTDLCLRNVEIHSNLAHGVLITTPTRLLIDGCISHDNGDAQAKHGFSILTNGSNVIIRGCVAYNNSSSGIASQAGTTDISVINCQAYDNADTNISLNADSVVVTGCIASNSTNFSGIVIGHSANPASYAVVSGNLCNDNNWDGIRIQDGNSVSVTGNTCRNNSLQGISVIGTNTRTVSVVGNICDTTDDATTTPQTTGHGISFKDTEDFVCLGNITLNASGSGINIYRSPHGTVLGNLSRNNGQDGDGRGIYVLDDGVTISTDITYMGNVCYDDQGSPTQDYGLYEQNASDFNVIMGNILRNNQFQSIIVRGASSFVDGNVGTSIWATTLSDAAHTGDTNETDLQATTIESDELGRTGALQIQASGTAAGTAGTKTIRLKFDTLTIATITLAGGDTDDWLFDAELYQTATNAQRISVKGFQGSAIEVVDYVTGTIDTAGSDRVLKVTAQLGNSGDTVTQTIWKVRRIR